MKKKQAASAKKTVKKSVKTPARKPAPAKKPVHKAAISKVRVSKAKPPVRKPAAKPVVKQAVKKPTARPAAKPVKKAVRPAAKPVVKQAVKKPADRPVARPAAKPVPVRPVPFFQSIRTKKITIEPVRRPQDTDDKVTKLTKSQVQEFKARLLDIKGKIVDDISGIQNEMLGRSQKDASGDLSGYGIHLADAATDNYDREMGLRIAGNEQEVLYEVDAALQRIEDGTFGQSELSGKFIGLNRLRAIPYTRYTLEEAAEIERRRRR